MNSETHKPLCTFMPTPRQVDLLCKLFALYRAIEPTAERLKELREELGAQEFKHFESDLAELLKKNRAWKAIEIIIRQALVRKREMLAARGARPVITEDKLNSRMRRAEATLREEARIARGN
jgi:hypothetical protein